MREGTSAFAPARYREASTHIYVFGKTLIFNTFVDEKQDFLSNSGTISHPDAEFMAAHGLIGETTTDVSGHVDRRVLYLRRLFLDDLSHNWSLGEMAERVNISTSHLGRLFLSETGFPPKQFLRELRLDHAAQLLQESFLTIKQIRLSLGLNDKTMFVNAFKAKYGATPREYRLRVAGAVEYRTKPDGITGMRGNTTK